MIGVNHILITNDIVDHQEEFCKGLIYKRMPRTARKLKRTTAKIVYKPPWKSPKLSKHIKRNKASMDRRHEVYNCNKIRRISRFCCKTEYESKGCYNCLGNHLLSTIRRRSVTMTKQWKKERTKTSIEERKPKQMMVDKYDQYIQEQEVKPSRAVRKIEGAVISESRTEKVRNKSLIEKAFKI